MAETKGAIAAVNHWRGQCLDNFARAEKAIILAICELAKQQHETGPALNEAAANRTKDLASSIRQRWPKESLAIRAAGLLDTWRLREKQRNQLVHGCFTVKGDDAERWFLINEINEVRKGVNVVNRIPISRPEGAAFLDAVIVERKALEAALKELKSLGT